MQINMAQVLQDIYGKPVKRPDNGEEATLRYVCIEALLSADDVNPSEQEKLKRYEIALKLSGQDQPELSIEEAAKLKERVGKIYGAGVVGPVFGILEQAAQAPVAKPEPSAGG